MARSKALNDKNEIIDAALSIVEQEGIDALSIRRLASALGVSSMTLYNYVRNVDDIHREILVRSFQLLLQEIYAIMQTGDWERHSGLAIFARAYACALFQFAKEHRHLCIFLIGKGASEFRNDAEIRPFYNMFDDFLLPLDDTDTTRQVKQICWMYECAVLSMIHEYVDGIKPVTKEILLHCVDTYIEKMFPNGGINQ